jgi:hypothetical protein
MAGLSPTSTDDIYDFIFKIAQNFYLYAFSLGITGLNAPRYGFDSDVDLLKKICYSTATINDHG